MGERPQWQPETHLLPTYRTLAADAGITGNALNVDDLPFCVTRRCDSCKIRNVQTVPISYRHQSYITEITLMHVLCVSEGFAAFSKNIPITFGRKIVRSLA